MNRFTAGLGGGLGAIGGAFIGSYVGPFYDRRTRRKAEKAGTAFGAIVGAFTGAMIGAGSDAPKQVGTSGALGLLGEWGVGAASISVAGGGFYTAPVGATVTLESPGGLWQSPGVLTSDATVLAPSNPSTTNSFVAVAPGIALLSGTTSDGRIASARVTVVSSEAVQPAQSKLSTGEIVGISAAGATAFGGVIYLATRKPKRRRRR